jgi:hypothetical protein
VWDPNPYDPGFWASEDSTCFRPLSYRDRKKGCTDYITVCVCPSRMPIYIDNRYDIIWVNTFGFDIDSYQRYLEVFLVYVPKVGSCDPNLSCPCVCVSPLVIVVFLKQIYETWHIYHGTWAHLNGLLLKFLPSLSVSVCVLFLSLEGNGSLSTSQISVLGNGSGKYIPNIGARQRLG